MPLIVYTHPRGQSSRVFLSGLGVFEHGVPRYVEDSAAAAILGELVNGRFERNGLFSLQYEALPRFVQPVEPVVDEAPESELPPVMEADAPIQPRKRRKKES